MKKLLISAAILLNILCLLRPSPVTAESTINVTQDRIVSDFPSKLTFQLSANSSVKIQTIKLLYRTNGTTCQSAIAQQVIDFTPETSVEVAWDWDFTRAGILPPGAEINWQWQISDASGNSLLTKEQSYLVNDIRHKWNLLTSEQVKLQWYEGSKSFGQSLLDIAIHALERLASDAGVHPTGQIWVTIYPTVEELLEVDIHASEWAGGIAYTEYNATMIAIGTNELNWAGSVIPHELGHLVTDAVIYNCRGMWLPTWLSEGLAVYAEGQIYQGYVDIVTSALEKGMLPPLRTLESGFSSVSDEADLSYGHSGMIVTYIIDQYGAEKMTKLLEAIKSGQKIDNALMEVYGKDTDGIEAEWRVSLGYAPQPTLAPTSSSRTSVPTIALWTSVVHPSATPTSPPSPTATQALPTDTPEPPPSPTLPVRTSGPTATTAASNSGNRSIVVPVVILVTVILIIIIGIVVLKLMKGRRKSS